MSPAPITLEFVAVTILIPLPISKDGYRFILVINDRITNLTNALTMKEIKSDAFARVFVCDCMFKYKYPKDLISDKGSQFFSLLFQQFGQMFSI